MPAASHSQPSGELKELSTRLARSRQALFDAISGFDEQRYRVRPADGGWSAAETLAHLLDWEELLNSRIALALERDGAELTPTTDAEHDAKAALGQTAPVPQLTHGLQATRRRSESLLAAMKQADFDRCLLHPIRGERVPVRAMVEKLIVHEEEHTAYMERLRSLLPEPLTVPLEAVKERSP
jgi:uncharacterized damage-inducible protein DinB